MGDDDRLPLPQGTLDLLILRTLALEPLHGWAVSERLQQLSSDVAAGAAGLALSGPAPPPAQGVDHAALGHDRSEPAREVPTS